MTIYIVDLEKIESRYTTQWAEHIPKLLQAEGFDVCPISGPDDLPKTPTPGMFLDFAATNIYKAAQVEKIARLFNTLTVKDGDYFLFTDAWHPGIINLKYMSSLLGVSIKVGACWHSGSYDSWDGLGRLIGNAPWVRHAEQSFFHAIDHNYFATDFHIEMFTKNLLGLVDRKDLVSVYQQSSKIVKTGWPMEYMSTTLQSYSDTPKKDLILFPHRIAPEKQVEIFRDLAKQLPQYEFVVCQDTPLTKHEYHSLLAQAKMVFSANLQETLGISTCAEGPLTNCIPLAPNRVSYTEIFDDYPDFLYPAKWTEDWTSYLKFRDKLVEKIVYLMINYNALVPTIQKFNTNTLPNYFHANALLETIPK